MAHAHAQVLARAALICSVGVWELISNGGNALGGLGLMGIAIVYLALEHRRSKRLDDRTENLIDHLERLAGVRLPEKPTNHERSIADDERPVA